MVSDAEARKVARALMERFDYAKGKCIVLGYVLASKDSERDARLRESCQRAETLARKVYSALDDPEADWPKTILALLNQEPVAFGDDVFDRAKLIKGLEEEKRKREGP